MRFLSSDFEQRGPRTLAERRDVAWAAWSDRLYLVDREGRVASRGGPGPMGFRLDELEQAIEALLGSGTGR